MSSVTCLVLFSSSLIYYLNYLLFLMEELKRCLK